MDNKIVNKPLHRHRTIEHILPVAATLTTFPAVDLTELWTAVLDAAAVLVLRIRSQRVEKNASVGHRFRVWTNWFGDVSEKG